MSDRRWWAAAAVFCASVCATTAAWGLPWDVDMADGAFVKGYERAMPGLPDGVVGQPSVTLAKNWTPDLLRGSEAGNALGNPYGSTPEELALGGKMYQISCAPCHGKDGVTIGPVGQPGRFPGVVPLGGPGGVARNRSDGWIYLTIRNGGAIMPPYGHALSDREMWAIVSHVRTLDNARYVPPEAP